VVTAYVSVGANIAPEKHIPIALALLAERVEVTAISTFFHSRPLRRPDQEEFLNGAVQIRTPLAPRVLKFDVLRAIEARLGRVRTADKHAARVIDLDLLLYGDAVLSEEDLTLPDPDIRQRNFIAVPLLELDATLRLPDTGERLADLVGPHARANLRVAAEFTEQLRSRRKT
jgi:2-amino-4-hydroxy-6-hydroxymethyldihydropteridine diphosphokinase